MRVEMHRVGPIGERGESALLDMRTAHAGAQFAAVAALFDALDAWERFNADRHITAVGMNAAGDPLAIGMVKTLHALIDVAVWEDAEALAEVKGPVRWARAYSGAARNRTFDRGHAGRHLISVVDRWLNTPEVRGALGAPSDEAPIRRLSMEVCTMLGTWGALEKLVPTPERSRLDMETRTRAAITRAFRNNGDAKKIAGAILRAWDQTKDTVRNILKDKDT